MSTQEQATGFLAALFDFSFSSFITAKLIRVLYALGLLMAGVSTLFVLATSFTQGFMFGVVMLILAPLVFLFLAMYMRVMLEVLMVLFRIAEDVRSIANSRAAAQL